MYKKMIVIALLAAVFLSSCTLRVCTPAHINYSTGKQLYSCVDYRKGAKLPVVTVINPYRQMSKR